MQEDVSRELDEAVAAMDAAVLRTARRHPHAFPSASSSIDSMLASGERVRFPNSTGPPHEGPLSELAASLAEFEKVCGFSLLTYSAPSTPALADHAMDDADTAWEAAFGAGGGLSWSQTVEDGGVATDETAVEGGGGGVDGLASLLPITAALVAARKTARFDGPALTRQQVRDVLCLRQAQQRHGARIDDVHARLEDLVTKLEQQLDSTELQHQLRARLTELCGREGGEDEGNGGRGQMSQRFAVSGQCEESVWRRWVAASPSAGAGGYATNEQSKSLDEVVALSLVNKQRLDKLLARWALAKRQHNVLVERANRAASEVARVLAEGGGQ